VTASSAPELIVRASSLNRALGVLGDWWTILILRDAFLGVRSFERFHERLAIPRQTLANRLRALVADGIFYLRTVEGAGPRAEYKLTAKGLELYPHVLLAWRWERRWLGTAARAIPATLVHTRCGRPMQPRLTCGHCHDEVRLADVLYRAGPGAAAEVAEPARAKRSSRTARIAGVRGARAHEALATSVYILADRWAHLTLGAVFLGQREFEAIRASLGVATNILSHRLSVLVGAKFLEKRRSAEDARRFEYRLTDRGRDVFPITLALVRWADRWLPNPRGPAMERTHAPCGARLHVEVTCSACGVELAPWEVRPGGPQAAVSKHRRSATPDMSLA
jgi:DNA-binding HxlR family transcriptional regulator